MEKVLGTNLIFPPLEIATPHGIYEFDDDFHQPPNILRGWLNSSQLSLSISTLGTKIGSKTVSVIGKTYLKLKR